MIVAHGIFMPESDYRLDYGFELSFKDEDDNTLLHYAAYSNNVETIRFFLKRGLDVNTENKMGINPLQFAALNTSNVDVIKERPCKIFCVNG